MEIDISKKIAWAIEHNEQFRKSIVEKLQAGSFIIVAEYKRQSPVNKGFLRNNVESEATDNGFVVQTLAGASSGLSGGTQFGYPKYVSEGTYDFKGGPDYGYTTGYTRLHAGNKSRKDLNGQKGTRPNKFAYRTSREVAPKLIDFFFKNITPLFQI
jgi:hypothetical protein